MTSENRGADYAPERSPVSDEATPEERTKGSRKLALLVLIGAAAAITIVIGILTASTESDRTEPVNDWDSPELAPAEELSVGDGKYEALVIISTDDDAKACWNGYIGSEVIEGCGDAVFDVSGAPRVLGANVRHEEKDKHFIGIALWAHGQRLERDQSTAVDDVVAVSGPIS